MVLNLIGPVGHYEFKQMSTQSDPSVLSVPTVVEGQNLLNFSIYFIRHGETYANKASILVWIFLYRLLLSFRLSKDKR
jgi:hypothetical protein